MLNVDESSVAVQPLPTRQATTEPFSLDCELTATSVKVEAEMLSWAPVSMEMQLVLREQEEEKEERVRAAMESAPDVALRSGKGMSMGVEVVERNWTESMERVC